MKTEIIISGSGFYLIEIEIALCISEKIELDKRTAHK
jgi:hypothetical protein